MKCLSGRKGEFTTAGAKCGSPVGIMYQRYSLNQLCGCDTWPLYGGCFPASLKVLHDTHDSHKVLLHQVLSSVLGLPERKVR